jgi:hypothetical protein
VLNLSLETICKIEKSLGITLVSVSVPVYENSQVILDSFAPNPYFISKNYSKPIGSEKTDYKSESKYQPHDEPIAA